MEDSTTQSKALDQKLTYEDLVEIIAKQKEHMAQVVDLFKHQHLSGFERALVVYKGAPIKTFFSPEEEYQFVREGTLVSIPEDSKFFKESYRGLAGTVDLIDPDGFPGWLQVKFPDGQTQICRYGKPDVDNGVSDLIVVSKMKNTLLSKQTFTANLGGRLIEIGNDFDFEINVGNTVLLHPANNQIVAKLEGFSPTGVRGIVNTILEDGRLDVSVEGSPRIVCANPEWVQSCNRGDEVLIDSSLSVALEVVNKKARSVNRDSVGKMTLNDVIGLEEAKEEIRDHLREIQHRELYESATFGTMHSDVNAKGMLLVGPPGNGKTLLVKAAAKEHQLAILTLPSTEALQKYVGDGPALIRSYKSEAEKIFVETGKPVIVFVDEIDAIARKRSNDGNNEHLNSLTIALLTTIDGTDVSKGVLWIAATNREELLDPAITRAGRLSRKVFVGRPTKEDVPKFFELYLRGVKIKELNTSEMVLHATESFLSEKHLVYELFYIKKDVDMKDLTQVSEEQLEKVLFTLFHAGSGAMLASIVSMAMRKALRRDVEQNLQTFTGITKEDIEWAISETYQGILSINIDDAIQDFLSNEKRTPFREVSYRKK